MHLLADVEAGHILEVVWVSLLAGVSVTVTFSFVVLGGARSSEARRAGRGVAATGYAILAALAFLVFAGSVVFAVQVLLTK